MAEPDLIRKEEKEKRQLTTVSGETITTTFVIYEEDLHLGDSRTYIANIQFPKEKDKLSAHYSIHYQSRSCLYPTSPTRGAS